jgi:hypothetical protein
MIPDRYLIAFCILIITISSLNFNDWWVNSTFRKIKDNRGTWFWFRVFNIPETRENYTKSTRLLSGVLIAVMILTLVFKYLNQTE